MIKLVIADDEHLVRQAIVSLLSLNEDFQVVGEASNGKQAAEMAQSHGADIVLMDIQMPIMDGVKATQLIKQSGAKVNVLVLTTYDDDALIADAIKSGASGYLLKDAGADEISSAVRAVHNGYTALGASIAPKLMSQLSSKSGAAQERSTGAEGLTPKEKQILTLLKQGKTNSQMAKQLNVTEKTVRDHMVNILSHLGLRDRTQAALWAQKHLD